MRSYAVRARGRVTTHINTPLTIDTPNNCVSISLMKGRISQTSIPDVRDTSGAFGNEVPFVPIVLHRDVTVHDSGMIRDGYLHRIVRDPYRGNI